MYPNLPCQEDSSSQAGPWFCWQCSFAFLLLSLTKVPLWHLRNRRTMFIGSCWLHNVKQHRLFLYLISLSTLKFEVWTRHHLLGYHERRQVRGQLQQPGHDERSANLLALFLLPLFRNQWAAASSGQDSQLQESEYGTGSSCEAESPGSEADAHVARLQEGLGLSSRIP